ncbi:hypothetical protein OIE69_43805 (plasmid) [Actinacidiphila glaucinigra]|uniref:hypothetical protein n=1 Tax=Actinacidiphila glaucinigra TaxID=235986 RepID=UPI002DDBD0C2|nr:hypothetical protein [Actinacidiphila glaucinigra]WSD65833.1 hypothetical protein OIE69_43805 [Actinacidiphila glaucinigra]
MTVARLEIAQAADQHGVTGWSWGTTWRPSCPNAFHFATQAAAGEIADRRQMVEAYGIDPTEAAHLAGSTHDRDQAIALLAAVGYPIALEGPAPEGGGTWEQVTEAAAVVVAELWEPISRTAVALLIAPGYSLPGERVVDILRGGEAL